MFLKFIYSEKATKFCEISTLLLSVCTLDKSEVEISQNLVAFSEYTNFTCEAFQFTQANFGNNWSVLFILNSSFCGLLEVSLS